MSKAERIAYLMDTWRVWPRVLIALATWYVAKCGTWFMGLDHPGVEQAGFVSAVSVAYAKILDWYMQNGVDWEKRKNGTS